MADTKYILVALTEAERDLLVNSVRLSLKLPFTEEGRAIHQALIDDKLSGPPALDLPTETIQRLIITRLVKDSLAAGYEIEVFDHTNSESSGPATTDLAKILGSIFDPEIDASDYMLHYWKPGGPGGPGGKGAAGWVRLVDGNGASVINDYTTNLEAVVKGANELADALEEFED